MSNFGLPNHGWSSNTTPLAGSAMKPSRRRRPSRSTQSCIAWRTRLSAVGAPGSVLSCHGQVCGYGFEVIWKPFTRSCGIASDGGASIQSTCPDRSAATRVFASGIGISSRRSVFGTRWGFQ